MTRSPCFKTLTVAALAILATSCSSNNTPNGGSGGSRPSAGGASGGATTASTGGQIGTGGSAPGVGGSGGVTSSAGSSGSVGTGGSSTGTGNGGMAGGRLGSGGSGSGGSGSGGSGSGGSGSGGSGSGGSGSGGLVGGSGSGGSGSGGTTGAGGTTSTGIQACPSLPGAPPPGTGLLPSPAQVAYQRTEMTAYIHFSMATYDGSEQGNPSDPPSMFNPTNLNATTVRQWTSALKAAGFRQAMFVTKHSVGFCLWPSKYTDYSVKNSPWMSGKGDIVQLFTDAMHADGLRVALYLAPWDQKYPSSKSDYETYYKNQLTEILSYGPAYEIEFDGFNSPTSGNVDWKSVYQYIKQTQPNILTWAGPEIARLAIPDLQWIGNENGQASRTTSSLDTTNCGGGKTYCPYECTVSSHRPNWFWHPGSSPMSLSDMQKVYWETVGMNCTVNFNVPPSQTGEFDPKDLALLQQFGTWYSALLQTNLIKGQPATADSTWATAGFEAAKAVDDDICTYWAPASGKTSGRLEVTPASSVTANVISIREAIELGERVTKYHVEIKQNGNWNTAPTDKSGTKIQGTVIGNRQLWQLGGTPAEAVALVIDSATDVPAIAEFGVY